MIDPDEFFLEDASEWVSIVSAPPFEFVPSRKDLAGALRSCLDVLRSCEVPMDAKVIDDATSILWRYDVHMREVLRG